MNKPSNKTITWSIFTGEGGTVLLNTNSTNNGSDPSDRVCSLSLPIFHRAQLEDGKYQHQIDPVPPVFWILVAEISIF